MAWARVQGTGIAGTGSITTLAKAFASNVTAGNLLVCCIGDFNMGTTPSVTDSLGNTWNKAVQTGTTAESCAIFWTVTASGGPCTVTYHSSGGAAFPAITIDEFSFTGGTTVIVDNSNSGGGVVSLVITWNSVTVTGTDLIIAAVQMGQVGATPFTPGAGMSLGFVAPYVGSVNEGIGMEYGLNVASSPFSPQMTVTGALGAAHFVDASFKPATAGARPLFRPPTLSLGAGGSFFQTPVGG